MNTEKKTHSFQNFRTIYTFGGDIDNRAIALKKADKDQSDLLVEVLNSKKQVKPKNPEKKQQKEDDFENLYNFFEGRERVLNAFDSKTFPIKIEGTGPSQMLQRLPIALAQVKTGNTSENLLNEIKQIIYSLYRAKEVTKNVYNNIMNSIKI